jgi:DNA-binding CsgD family transcriptional regulator
MFMKLRYADLRGALASATFLQGFCERHYAERHHYAQENLSLRGWLLYLLDHIPEARQVLHKLVILPVYDNRQENTRYFGSLILQLCDLAETGNPTAVLRSIDHVEDAARWAHTVENDFAGTPSHIAWPRILRDYRAGHPERCRQTIESMRLTPADINEQMLDTARVAVLAGFVLSGQSSPQLAAQLAASAAYFDSVHAAYMAMQVRLLSALYFLQRGNKHEALSRLRKTLPLIERSGATRLLLDFPALHELLPQCDSPLAQQLLARIPTPRASFRLTAQETRVLNHLADGRTTKEIAALHVVSHRTIYMQLYQIFKKLNVHSREEAVRVWRGEGSS